MNGIPDNIRQDWNLLGQPLREKVEELRADIATYANSPGGAWLTADIVADIDHQLEQIRHRIHQSKPYAMCSNWPSCKRGCRLCHESGFLPRRVVEAMEKEGGK